MLVPLYHLISTDEARQSLNGMKQGGLVQGVGHLLPRIDAPLERCRFWDLDWENHSGKSVSKERIRIGS